MITTDTDRKEPVTVLLEEGVPVRVDWGGTRYYVDEPPEPRGRLVPTLDGTSPDPTTVTGWRIVASSPAGEQHAFAVTSRGGARWWLTSLDS